MPPKVYLRNQKLPQISETYIAGVDEAGRGALAGPVVAAAVILNPKSPIEGCVDSKKLSATRRDYLAAKIKDNALAWAIGYADNKEINRVNILNATLLAMKRAVEGLDIKAQHILIDGNRCPPIDTPCAAIIGGDDRLACIAAASILAKTTRDSQMRLWANKYPKYYFDEHKGYATQKHVSALANHGSCALHRTAWRAVRTIVAQGRLFMDRID